MFYTDIQDSNNITPTLEELQKFQDKPADKEGEETDSTGIDINPSINLIYLSTYLSVYLFIHSLIHFIFIITLASLTTNLRPKKKASFVKGDSVKVIEGDLKHLTGVVDSVEEDTVTIMPTHEELHVCLISIPKEMLDIYRPYCIFLFAISFI